MGRGVRPRGCAFWLSVPLVVSVHDSPSYILDWRSHARRTTGEVPVLPYDEFSSVAQLLGDRDARPSYRVQGSVFGEWLSRRAPWQLFVTLTIKDLFGDSEFHSQGDGRRSYWGEHREQLGFTSIGVAGSERFLRKWFRESVRSRAAASGQRAYGAFALEQHRDRVTPHFHGLLGGLPAWLVTDTALGRNGGGGCGSYLWRDWFSDHGRARMEPVRGSVGRVGSDVALGAAIYAAKYVCKDSGKFYALGSWPPVSEYDEGMLSPDELEARWEMLPGSANAERVWREMCEGLPVRF